MEATEKTYEITYPQPMIDEDHKDPLWYGGRVAEVRYKGYTFVLGAYGDVIATLLTEDGEVYVKDKNNAGLFYDEMHPYIKSDRELYSLESDGRLTLDYNNWFEVVVIDSKGEQHDLGWVCDSFNYEDAVQEIFDLMDLVISELESPPAKAAVQGCL